MEIPFYDQEPTTSEIIDMRLAEYEREMLDRKVHALVELADRDTTSLRELQRAMQSLMAPTSYRRTR